MACNRQPWVMHLIVTINKAVRKVCRERLGCQERIVLVLTPFPLSQYATEQPSLFGR